MVVMDMAWPTTGTVMVWLITVTTVPMLTLMVLTDTTTARGPLMLSPRLRLMLTMVVMDMAWPTTGTVMVWLIMVLTTVLMLTLMLTDTTTARGPLMPSPLLTHTT